MCAGWPRGKADWCQQSTWFILGCSLALEVDVRCLQGRLSPSSSTRAAWWRAVILAGLGAEGWRCPILLESLFIECDLKTFTLALSAY